MRVITLIVIHCSDIGPHMESSAKDIDLWHKQNGWGARWGDKVFHIGYHYVVRRDGSIEKGRPIELKGAHVKNHNRHSIGICYEGGKNALGQHADTRTPAQKAAIRQLVAELQARFPKALVVGHRDLDPTRDCPCFDVAKEL